MARYSMNRRYPPYVTEAEWKAAQTLTHIRTLALLGAFGSVFASLPYLLGGRRDIGYKVLGIPTGIALGTMLLPKSLFYSTKKTQKKLQTPKSVRETVLRLVARRKGIKPDQINEGTHFVNDLRLDPLDRAELLVDLEETFGVNIDHVTAAKIKTVGQAIKYIQELQKEKA